MIDPQLIVVAFGGNAVYPPTIKGTAQEQLDIMAEACEHLVPMFRAGYRVVLTHGNGPVVGNILFRMAQTSRELLPMPMDVCVAHSQGGIGLHAAAEPRERAGAARTAARRVVDRHRGRGRPPTIRRSRNPTKPVGRFFSEADAKRIARRNRLGLRRGLGARLAARRALADAAEDPRCAGDQRAARWPGVIPIAAGGGGIPVVRDADGAYRGVAAVIDKDLTSSLLAADVGAGTLVMLTGVDRVALDFGKPTQRVARAIDRGGSGEARRRRPVSAGQHGSEDHGGAALPRARRPARAHHVARQARRGACRPGGDGDRFVNAVLSIGAKARAALERSGGAAAPLAAFPDAPYYDAAGRDRLGRLAAAGDASARGADGRTGRARRSRALRRAAGRSVVAAAAGTVARDRRRRPVASRRGSQSSAIRAGSVRCSRVRRRRFRSISRCRACARSRPPIARTITKPCGVLRARCSASVPGSRPRATISSAARCSAACSSPRAGAVARRRRRARGRGPAREPRDQRRAPRRPRRRRELRAAARDSPTRSRAATTARRSTRRGCSPRSGTLRAGTC